MVNAYARSGNAERARRRGALLVDAIVGSVIIGVSLAALVGVAANALSVQAEGEELRTAAALIDERLNLVLAFGPDDFGSRFPTRGACDPPFENYTYTINIAGGSGGDAYEVTAGVSWISRGRERSESVTTLIAPRLGDEPDPDRRPDEVVERFE